MSFKQTFNIQRIQLARSSAFAVLFVGALLLLPALAVAQDQTTAAQNARDNDGFLASISRWFKAQTAVVNSSFEDARKKVEGFNSAAGDAAKTTVEGAKDAAGAIARIPATRAVSGHEKCLLAANGAPDCVAAANAMCKTKGFESGKSVDMTTADVCPAKVYLSGRSTGPECTTETFVSRAICQ
jgi:hypothetical protein